VRYAEQRARRAARANKYVNKLSAWADNINAKFEEIFNRTATDMEGTKNRVQYLCKKVVSYEDAIRRQVVDEDSWSTFSNMFAANRKYMEERKNFADLQATSLHKVSTKYDAIPGQLKDANERLRWFVLNSHHGLPKQESDIKMRDSNPVRRPWLPASTSVRPRAITTVPHDDIVPDNQGLYDEPKQYHFAEEDYRERN
jgi:hypothetical protein